MMEVLPGMYEEKWSRMKQGGESVELKELKWLRGKFVYVAGPYSGGDGPVRNTRRAIAVGEALLDIGAVPYVPHVSLLWDIVSPHPPKFWYEYDLNILARCDAMVVVEGSECESYGVQLEVQYAMEHDIPIWSTGELFDVPYRHYWKRMLCRFDEGRGY